MYTLSVQSPMCGAVKTHNFDRCHRLKVQSLLTILGATRSLIIYQCINVMYNMYMTILFMEVVMHWYIINKRVAPRIVNWDYTVHKIMTKPYTFKRRHRSKLCVLTAPHIGDCTHKVYMQKNGLFWKTNEYSVKESVQEC